MFSRMGSAAFRKDLTNIRQLCQHLGNPQDQFRSIHVGGTNGKGSVSHMMASILQEAGYKTGLYTSPHLYDFRERIRINGTMVEEQFVIDFTEKIQPLIQELQPSFFEITVAMAFDYFARQQVDMAVIEVGLGGRIDSTNIINPELSIITNIGWDHMNMLGNTLEAIAGEKAGIIKSTIPVVIGEKQPETENIFIQSAAENNAPLFFAEDHFLPADFQWRRGFLQLHITDRQKNKLLHYELDLPGIYQLKNCCTVLTAVKVLNETRKVLIDEHTVAEGLQHARRRTGLQGRWELIHSAPDVILEVAHNPDGIQQMLQQVGQQHFHELHMVIGMVKDKDVDAVLKLLPTQAHYYFTQAQLPRALDKKELQQKAEEYHLSGDVFEDVNAALKTALANASSEDLILVCGSIFLAAEVDRTMLNT